MSVNKMWIKGFLGQDPKTKTFDNGNNVTQFSVATTETWKNQAGEKQSKTEWHQVSAWGKHGEAIAKYFKKGDEIFIEGKMEYKKDKQDEKKIWPVIRVLSFDFCGKKGSNSGGGGYSPDASDAGPSYGEGNVPDHDEPSSTGSGSSSFPDDDIPF